MKIVRAIDVLIRDGRQRREFDIIKIRELAQSIREQGLMHPPSVRKENGKLYLVAGERRMRAIAMLDEPFRCGENWIQPGELPVNDFGEIDELHSEELELAENVRRQNLSWQEETEAWARLHALRLRQNSTQTKAATVSEILNRPATGDAIKKLGQAILLQAHMDDPNVAKAKTEREALALVERKLAAKKAEVVASMVKAREKRHQVITGDCREVLGSIPSDSIDCILTDPPYGIDADKHRAASTSEAGYLHSYDDSEETAFSIMDAIFREGYRVAKAKAHLFMFLDFRHWRSIEAMARDHGWDPHPYPIIWARGGGMVGDYRRTPQRAYDMVLFARKGDAFVQKTAPDVIQIPMLDGAKRHHAAEKPVDLYENLLSRAVISGATVLDPCCGAGPLFPAANRLGCYAIGIEGNPDLANISITRFEEDL